MVLGNLCLKCFCDNTLHPAEKEEDKKKIVGT